MKKLTLSVVALLIAGTSYIAGTNHSIDKEVTFTRYEVMEMLNTIEEILSWQQEDIERAEYNNQEPDCGKHSEKWGSNYWLTEIRDELYNKLNIKEQSQDEYYNSLACENCDEVD